MGLKSDIEWTDHTFNPWWGCIKVSPGCTNCYAEAWAKRYGHNVWGKNTNRRKFSDQHWKQPLKWDQKAQQDGNNYRVFCASMADVFEQNNEVDEERTRLWNLIEQTTALNWLLLTKRPANMNDMAPWGEKWPDNVWAMTTTENQKMADSRIPDLLSVPAKVRGLSVEPMVGPVNLEKYLHGIHWVIVGGESGSNSRPMHPDWVKLIREQCLEYNVPFFFKQWGNWVPCSEEEGGVIPNFKLKNLKYDFPMMKRVSKKKAGRILDGQYWNQLPVVAD